MFLKQYIHDVKSSWIPFFENEFKKVYFNKLDLFLKNEFQSKIIYPKPENIFRAFTFFGVEQTALVILGQDPYQTENMADGLAFSTQLDIKPKSLGNLFNEIKKDLGVNRDNYDLSDIAKQNVLLLNRTLTVRKNVSLSHVNQGWEIFTDNVISYLSAVNAKVIYLLMGKNAISIKPLIHKFYKIYETSHPSPFSYSRNLEGKGIFKKINQDLRDLKIDTIKW